MKFAVIYDSKTGNTKQAFMLYGERFATKAVEIF